MGQTCTNCNREAKEGHHLCPGCLEGREKAERESGLYPHGSWTNG